MSQVNWDFNLNKKLDGNDTSKDIIFIYKYNVIETDSI